VRVRDFLADVEALAAILPAGRHQLNVCQDRYRFTVGLAAGLVSGKTSLQPASQSVGNATPDKSRLPGRLLPVRQRF
jgi:carbon monoxide dehydrogenase subunit G